jgi:hypothetical protein
MNLACQKLTLSVKKFNISKNANLNLGYERLAPGLKTAFSPFPEQSGDNT